MACYELKVDLNALNHLGIGLYSNIPAVVSEVVANSYDADATEVDILIDQVNKTVSIQDNGCGMTEDDINKKYLTVGYDKRKNEPGLTPRGRSPMGRKGIGKLSLFSIADVIEVHSVKRNAEADILEKNGFIMDVSGIKQCIEDGQTYRPSPVDAKMITINKGTRITLRNLRHGMATTEGFLRKRLARRFSVIGTEHDFNVQVNKQPIDIRDRDYFMKIEYIWYLGNESNNYADLCSNKKHAEQISGIIDSGKGYLVTGWVGTFDEQKSIDDDNNTIVIMARGKLIHEDILKDIKEGGVFSKYLIGEIHADFLDMDEREDIATSNRQSLREDDERFQALKKFIQGNILKEIQKVWREWRVKDAEKKAKENPKIKEWFESLPKDHKKYARDLFERIESYPIAHKGAKAELYRNAIVAFQTLAMRNSLTALDKIQSQADLEAYISIFDDLRWIEEVHYYDIVRARLDVLEKFENIVDANAKEKVLQDHIYKSLWLLDPSWERATTDKRIEEKVTTEFGKISAGLTKEEANGRVDIRYKTAYGKHVIIELKKYGYKVNAHDLAKQVGKYNSALKKCLAERFPGVPQVIECICIIGEKPQPHDDPEKVTRILRAEDARFVTYDGLIQQTQDNYRQYLEVSEKMSKFRDLVDSISAVDDQNSDSDGQIIV
ncbi:MAG: ATP-binding protein [Armatimonadetes bacterium]|nr:ATP-binding protein [Armatimonadota bacterium]